MDDLYDFTESSLAESKRYCICMLYSDECYCCDPNNEWEWDKAYSTHCITYFTSSKAVLEVEFFPTFSCGTAVARGNTLLEQGMHHYWEIEMINPLFGTDVMVGVGSGEAKYTEYIYQYSSVLGLDSESFGYSYRGYIQHAGIKRTYGIKFKKGDIVGVHLDTWKGTLEFFVNRRPLGIAFTGLKDTALYPLVSSTAYQTRMRLICSSSVPTSLQTECLAVLGPLERKNLSTMFPGLRYLSESVFAKILQKHRDKEM